MNELANQKLVLQKINGWKIYHLSAGMEDVVEMENDLSDRLEDFAQRLEDAASKYRDIQQGLFQSGGCNLGIFMSFSLVFVLIP